MNLFRQIIKLLFRLRDDHSIKPGVTSDVVVILVDMQTKFTKNLRHNEFKRILPNQLAVIRQCAEDNVPLIVLEMRRWRFGRTIKVLQEEIHKCTHFSLIRKNYNNGFTLTELHVQLQQLRAKRLLLMGINADACVHETAEGAINLGYDIITSKELISSDNKCWPSVLSWYRKKGHLFDSIESAISVLKLSPVKFTAQPPG